MKGIDTQLSNLAYVVASASRNGVNPMKGIDTLMALLRMMMVSLVEME